MYSTLLPLHGLVRWLLLISLLLAIFTAFSGWTSKTKFSHRPNQLRHWTATIAHIQMALGLCLYFVSPVIDFFRSNFSTAVHQREFRFFGMEHSLMMLTAVILISIGSAKAKRKQSDADKFKTMAIWFSIALVIILVAIPWPFSPFVSRPVFRPF